MAGKPFYRALLGQAASAHRGAAQGQDCHFAAACSTASPPCSRGALGHSFLARCHAYSPRFGPVFGLELRRANGEGRTDQWVRLPAPVASPRLHQVHAEPATVGHCPCTPLCTICAMRCRPAVPRSAALPCCLPCQGFVNFRRKQDAQAAYEQLVGEVSRSPWDEKLVPRAQSAAGGWLDCSQRGRCARQHACPRPHTADGMHHSFLSSRSQCRS